MTFADLLTQLLVIMDTGAVKSTDDVLFCIPGTNGNTFIVEAVVANCSAPSVHYNAGELSKARGTLVFGTPVLNVDSMNTVMMAAAAKAFMTPVQIHSTEEMEKVFGLPDVMEPTTPPKFHLLPPLLREAIDKTTPRTVGDTDASV